MRKLQETCEQVQQRANVLEVRIKDLKLEALAAKKANNTRGAMLKMKQIKQYEGDLIKLDGQLLMLDQQRAMIEGSQFDKQVFTGLD